ncbi:MAG: hypothetical protein AB7R89_08125 [Dehalococcoidia bacterium]
MKRAQLAIGLVLFTAFTLAGCTWSVLADEAATGQGAASTPDISLEWTDSETLAITAPGYTPGETVMVALEVTREVSSGGSTSRSSQQSATTVSAGADGVLSHSITIRAQPGTLIRVTVTDQNGGTRTAETSVA